MEQSLQVISRQERLEKWASRIMACRSSGMTIRAWCRENQVPEKSYYYWQRQLFDAVSRQKNPGQPAFAEITLPQPNQTTVPAVTVRCSGIQLGESVLECTFNRGICYYALGENEKAVLDFQAVEQDSPDPALAASAGEMLEAIEQVSAQTTGE